MLAKTNKHVAAMRSLVSRLGREITDDEARLLVDLTVMLVELNNQAKLDYEAVTVDGEAA